MIRGVEPCLSRMTDALLTPSEGEGVKAIRVLEPLLSAITDALTATFPPHYRVFLGVLNIFTAVQITPSALRVLGVEGVRLAIRQGQPGVWL